MKIFMVCLTIGLALVAAVGTATGAEYVWIGNGDYWHNINNWNPTGIPGSGDDVIIPNSTICRVGGAASCRSYDIGSGASIVVEAGASLTASANSEIGDDGALELVGDGTDPASFLVAGNMTISGKCGRIEMWNGRIAASSGTPTLTWQRTPGEGCSGHRIHGDGVIDVALVNKGYVWADHDGETLILDTEEKSGVKDNDYPGEWQARDGGILQVDTTVTGSARWYMFQDADSQIIINACLHELSGDVELSIGTLRFNAGFCTTGQFRATNVRIEVDEDTSSKYGGTCTSSFCP